MFLLFLFCFFRISLSGFYFICCGKMLNGMMAKDNIYMYLAAFLLKFSGLQALVQSTCPLCLNFGSSQCSLVF